MGFIPDEILWKGCRTTDRIDVIFSRLRPLFAKLLPKKNNRAVSQHGAVASYSAPQEQPPTDFSAKSYFQEPHVLLLTSTGPLCAILVMRWPDLIFDIVTNFSKAIQGQWRWSTLHWPVSTRFAFLGGKGGGGSKSWDPICDSFFYIDLFILPLNPLRCQPGTYIQLSLRRIFRRGWRFLLESQLLDQDIVTTLNSFTTK